MIAIKIIELISILGLMIHLLNPISYKVEELNINNMPQTAYTLSVNTQNPFVEVSSLLSHDFLYGFEKTSKMLSRCRSLFGTNGMFYDEFGLPYGILIIDGNVALMDSIGTPTVTIDKRGKAAIEEIKIKAEIKGEKNTIRLTGTNRAVPDEGWVLFNKIYGKTTRVYRKSINYIIKDNIIIKIIESEIPMSLNQGDYVLTNVNDNSKIVFCEGEKVEFIFNIENHKGAKISEAFQTGGWLVKEGVNIAKEYEPFIGYTTAPNPRTLIGVTEKGRLVIKVVDGRLPGISVGISGYEAAQLMLLEGCKYAAYLDGGASSTMIVKGKVVNLPSNGEEREVAHALSIGIKGFTKKRFFGKYGAY